MNGKHLCRASLYGSDSFFMRRVDSPRVSLKQSEYGRFDSSNSIWRDVDEH